jgi:hypothetical protein
MLSQEESVVVGECLILDEGCELDINHIVMKNENKAVLDERNYGIEECSPMTEIKDGKQYLIQQGLEGSKAEEHVAVRKVVTGGDDGRSETHTESDNMDAMM